ncbi:DUF2690 domain-containing protein [Sorangium sp. So ce296]|uniref:DUF2690 domain-containing protein n=1 Tax=Sorangium sp. So ce296 TaxID=3133296 RepID=UPI003F6207B1
MVLFSIRVILIGLPHVLFSKEGFCDAKDYYKKKTIVFTIAALAVGIYGCVAEPLGEGAWNDEENVDAAEQAVVSCTGTGCNGKDPVAMGCYADAVTPTNSSLARKYIRDSATGATLGYVEMRYSMACSAQWGRVCNYGIVTYAKAALCSKDDAIAYSAPVYKTDTLVNTTMRATPNSGYRVDGAIEPCLGDGCDYTVPHDGGWNWVVW